MPSVTKSNGNKAQPPASFAHALSEPGKDAERAYTLSALVARLGEASETEARLEIEGKSEAALIEMGRHVGTPRLCKELARNYGTFVDWLPHATEEQRDICGFVDADWLRIAVWAAREAEVRSEALKLGREDGATGKQLRETDADTQTRRGKRVRGILRAGMSHLSGGEARWTTKINAALSSSVTTVKLADTIRAMTFVAEEMLLDPAPGMVARRARSKLTLQSVYEHRAFADDLGAVVKAAQAVQVKGPVSQADVDLWDGIALTFFEQFVETIEEARESDPRIPAPTIIGLRGWFGRLSGKPSESVDAGGATTPEDASGADDTVDP